MTDDLGDVIAAIDVADFLDYEGVDWRRAGSGANLMLKDCPFCGGSKWKVYINKRKKIGLCFSGDCGARFNLFTYTRELLQVDNGSVARHLSDYAKGAGVIRPKMERPAIELPSAWEMPSSVPIPTPDGMTHPFLLNRNILPETQALYGLRWCDQGQWTYFDEGGRSLSMDYSKRIIIPVQDLDGTVQSFVGRDVTGEAEKRYLFPATLPGTGRFLYGAHLLSDQKKLIINEGPFDVIATHQAIDGLVEFKEYGVIGSFGLSIGINDDENDQLHRLLELKSRNSINELMFMWDGENGALNAAIRYGFKMIEHGFNVRVALLPFDSDPNEVSTEIVREAIRNARTLTKLQALQWMTNPPYSRSANA